MTPMTTTTTAANPNICFLAMPPCRQCGEPTLAMMGDVCGKCCKSNQRACNGKGAARTETAQGRAYRTLYAARTESSAIPARA